MRDDDFGYLTAAPVPVVDGADLFRPRHLYERTGRAAAYRSIVADLEPDRKAHPPQDRDRLPDLRSAA